MLITGGDSGISRSVAVLMAREGADISIVYLPKVEDAQDTKKMVEKVGRRAYLMALDLRESENCRRVVEEHMKAFGKLSVLVNNSAMQEICNDIRDINLNVVGKTYRMDILSMFAMCKFALPHMKRGASIINSCPVAARIDNPQLVDYPSTKVAIVTFTRSLAQQAPNGITLMLLRPA